MIISRLFSHHSYVTITFSLTWETEPRYSILVQSHIPANNDVFKFLKTIANNARQQLTWCMCVRVNIVLVYVHNTNNMIANICNYNYCMCFAHMKYGNRD